jgi:hypothetical protein
LRGQLILFLVLLVVAAACGAAQAVASWGPSRWASADEWSAADWPGVAVDRDGNALLVWPAFDERVPGAYFQIQARARSRSGRLGPILNLSELGPAPAWPEVAVDDDGDGIVAWQQHDTRTNWRIAARRVGRRGGLGPILMLSPEGAIGNLPRVAVAPGGRAVVAWTEYRDGTSRTVARRVSARGAVGPPLDLGKGSVEPPAITMDRRGVATVAWTDMARVVARRITSRAVSAPRVIASATPSASGLALVHAAADRDGDVVVGFRSGSGARPRLWMRRWRRSGALGRRLAVSPPRQSAGLHLALATDAGGDGAIVWTRALAHDRFAVYGRHFSRTDALGHVVRLGAGDRPDVAVDTGGDGIVVWQDGGDGETSAVRSRSLGRGGGFGPVRTIARDGRAPRVTADPSGRVVAVWQQATSPYRIGERSGVVPGNSR